MRLWISLILFLPTFAQAQIDGFIQKSCDKEPSVLIEHLQQVIAVKGLTVFNVIDHSAGGKGADIDLADNTLIIFGNPAIGSKILQCDPMMGIELPMKILVWKSNGKTQVGYWDPKAYSKYYKLGECKEILDKMNFVIDTLIKEAIEQS